MAADGEWRSCVWGVSENREYMALFHISNRCALGPALTRPGQTREIEADERARAFL
jgi:hypothetical protein